MKWWINKKGVNTGDIFDDGIPEAAPGEPGFTTDLVAAYVKKRGTTFSFDYMGRSPAGEQVYSPEADQTPPAEEAPPVDANVPNSSEVGV